MATASRLKCGQPVTSTVISHLPGQLYDCARGHRGPAEPGDQARCEQRAAQVQNCHRHDREAAMQRVTGRGHPALHVTASFNISPADGFPVQRIE